MSEKTCDIFCFRECGDKYDSLVLKKDIDNVEKLSLKKISCNMREDERHRMKKTPSYNRLEKYKCSTDRSKDDGKEQELRLYRKKV